MTEGVSAEHFAKLFAALTTDHDFRRHFFEGSREECGSALERCGLPHACEQLRANGSLVVSISKEEFLVATEPQVLRQMVAFQAKHSYCC